MSGDTANIETDYTTSPSDPCRPAHSRIGRPARHVSGSGAPDGTGCWPILDSTCGAFGRYWHI